MKCSPDNQARQKTTYAQKTNTEDAQIFLTDREVAVRYSVSRLTPWRWSAKGNFPKPVKLSEACTRWRLSDLEAWEADRAEYRADTDNKKSRKKPITETQNAIKTAESTAVTHDFTMPLCIEEYLARTSRLTTQQHGAYLLLMMDYWKNGPPPDDDAILTQITRLHPDAWNIQRTVLQKFFSIEGGHWIDTSLDAALVETQKKRRKAKERARTAAQSRWNK